MTNTYPNRRLPLWKKAARWMRGLGHERGFGLQSPFAYRFVTEVVCQRWPYYGYEPLQRRWPDADSREQKLCRLLFRMANMRQPRKVYVNARRADMLWAYVKGGCLSATTTDDPSQADMLVVDAVTLSPEQAAETGGRLHGCQLLALLGISRDDESMKVWQAMSGARSCGPAFELWRHGLIYADEAMHRQDYIINA